MTGDALIAKRQAQTLTPEEHQELIQLTESIEQAAVERITISAGTCRTPQPLAGRSDPTFRDSPRTA
jgi:hypothetical protein